MPEVVTYRRSDRVVHPKRPEWGVGVVNQVDLVTQDGRQVQRLTVTFEHHGRVVINTAIAPLLPAGDRTQDANPSMNATRTPTSASDGGWLAALERNGKPKGSELWALPTSFSDPFVNDATRLDSVLDSFRFGVDARGLIDWAIGQTGLSDPLSKYTRHDLEQAYQHYARDRELLMREMVRNLKRQGQQLVIEQAMSRCRIQEARAALSRAMRA
jgi:hypothetical protein